MIKPMDDIYRYAILQQQCIIISVFHYDVEYVNRCRVDTRVRGEGRNHGGLGLRRRGEGIGLRNGA